MWVNYLLVILTHSMSTLNNSCLPNHGNNFTFDLQIWFNWTVILSLFELISICYIDSSILILSGSEVKQILNICLKLSNSAPLPLSLPVLLLFAWQSRLPEDFYLATTTSNCPNITGYPAGLNQLTAFHNKTK